jgi:glycosyltransferase involved in cell wall biosynthesis
MKILQITPYFYPAWSYGGIPRVVYELSRALVKKGHDVTVCTTDVFNQDSRCNQSGKEAIVDGIKAHYFKNLSNTLAYNYQIFLPVGLGRFIQRTISGFDIIHFHGHRNFLNNIVHYYAIENKKPYILSGHGTVLRIERRIFAKVIFDKVFGKQILRDAVHFIAVSENEVKQYEQMGIEEEKITVIYNGIDSDAYDILPQKNSFREKYNLTGKKIILYLGKITPRKGLDFLVKAFSELKRDDTVLVIVGNDMGFKKKVVEIVEERSVADKVIFTGLLIGEEKRAAYQDADMLVYPAIYEIFGLVPFETIMCGTPVIVTDDCGCGEIIGKEGIGYTVKYNDVYGLRDKITEVLFDRQTAMQKTEMGKRFVRDKLSWEKLVSRYEEIYKIYGEMTG